MALRILWDKYETALLIEAWLNVEKGILTRQEAVALLSKSLRDRAVKNGTEIDDVFRNENGISMQLNNVQRLMQKQPDAKQHNTKIFIEMVEMYFTDRHQFDEILRVAKGGSSQMKTKEEMFADWLSANVAPGRLSDYFMSITDVEAFARKKRIISGSIYEVVDASVTSKIVNTINADRIFRFTHKRQMRNITEVAQLFHRYTKENQNRTAFPSADSVAENVQQSEVAERSEPVIDAEEKPVVIVTTQTLADNTTSVEAPIAAIKEEIPTSITVDENEALEVATEEGKDLVVDFTRDTDFAFSKPVSVSYFGEVFYETSWRKLYVRVCQILIEDYPHVFTELREGASSGDRKYLVYDEETSKRLTTPACIAEGFYVETNRSASDLMHNIKALLDICRVDYENLEICYRRSSSPQQSPALPAREVIDSEVEDPLLFYLNNHGLEYIDLRDRLGCLWVFGGLDISEAIRPLQKSGVSISFKSGGGNATGGKDAWWTKDRPTKLSLPEDVQAQDIPIKEEVPSDGRKAFNRWLATQSSSSGTVRTASWAVSKVGEYAANYQLIQGSIFDIDDPTNLAQIWEQLNGISEFVEFRKKNGVATFAFNKYIQFRGGEGAAPASRASSQNRPSVSRFEIKDARSEFASWLIERGFAERTANGYASAVSVTDEYARQHGFTEESLLTIAEVEDIKDVWDRLQADDQFSDYNRAQHNRFSAAMRQYIDYREGVTSPVQISPRKPAQSERVSLSSYGEGSDEKTRFAYWLTEHGFTDRTARWYASSVETIGAYIIEHGFASVSLYEMNDSSEIEAVWNKLQLDAAFWDYNRDQHNRFSAGVRQYIEYKSGRTAEGSSASQSRIDLSGTADGLRFEFEEWLRGKGVNSTTAQNRSSAVNSISAIAIQYAASTKPIFQITDPSELLQVWNKLRVNREFQDWIRGHSERYTVAIRYYDQFLKARRYGRAASSTSKTQPVSLPRKHPCQIEFETWLTESGTPEGSVQTYSEAVKRIGDYLLKAGKEYRHLFSIFGVPRLEHIGEALQQDQSYADEVGSVNTSLDFYALRKYIAFRKNDSADGLDEDTRNRFSALLRECFENGFRVNSMIDRNRFKQYYADHYGEDILLDEEVIVETIKQVGELQDDRVFVREGNSNGNLLDDIQADIAETFGLGASCIYISSVFEKYQHELASRLQIFSEEILCEQLLATSYGAYRVAKQFFFVRGKTPDASSDVQRVMKQSSLPMTYDQIHDVLWYIPVDQIKHSLVVTDGMVNVAQETYFYAFNLPVSTSELEHIAELVHAQLTQKAFITDSELRALISQYCPSVAINTESFSTWGLRNALAVLLRDRFSFNGAIISERGQEINMAQAFEAFCEAHEEMSLGELKDFAKEMNSPIYWESVFSKMLRISQAEFIKRSAVEFDVQGVDAVLDQLVEGDYVPLRKFSLFLHFPTASVKWNEYVLEGYAALYSRDFTLLHANYTATECCGAIVRKSSHIQDFKTLVTEVLAKSNEWKNQGDALALLVRKGYLQRRRYSEIESVIVDARQLREISAKSGGAGL